MLQDNQENRLKDREKKEYQSQESQAWTLKEPEVLYEAKSATKAFEEEFDKTLATAITGEELRTYMYDVIDTWTWKKK
jgi:hypothetical protein